MDRVQLSLMQSKSGKQLRQSFGGMSDSAASSETGASCLDELERLSGMLKSILDIKDRTWRFRKYRKCFTGKDAVRKMIGIGMVRNETQALELGNMMLQAGIFHHVVYEHAFKNEGLFYRYTVDDTAANGSAESDNAESEAGSVHSGGAGQNGHAQEGPIKIKSLLYNDPSKHRAAVANQMQNLYQNMAKLCEEVESQKAVIQALKSQAISGRSTLEQSPSQMLDDMPYSGPVSPQDTDMPSPHEDQNQLQQLLQAAPQGQGQQQLFEGGSNLSTPRTSTGNIGATPGTTPRSGSGGRTLGGRGGITMGAGLRESNSLTDTAMDSAPLPTVPSAALAYTPPPPAPLARPLPELISSPQQFSGDQLQRSAATLRAYASKDRRLTAGVTLVVVAGRDVCVTASPVAAGLHELHSMSLSGDDPCLDLTPDSSVMNWSAGANQRFSFPVYLLGQERSTGRMVFAVDVSEAKRTFHSFVQEQQGVEIAFKDLRLLLPSLPPGACSIAGQAVALSQWHQTHQFCPTCGGGTVAASAGARRQCKVTPAHTLHPQMEPVVMMLIESAAGDKVLLARSKALLPGLYTCISGYIDPCEPIEQAVRRRAEETANLAVGRVRLLSTQPWPVGRVGSCEVVIGCVAKALDEEVQVDALEMEDVRWYTRADLVAAIRLYEHVGGTGGGPSHEARVQKASWGQLGFFLPPAFSIAHHIIKSWALSDGSWFADETEPLAGSGGMANGVNPNGEVGRSENHDNGNDSDTYVSASGSSSSTSTRSNLNVPR